MENFPGNSRNVTSKSVAKPTEERPPNEKLVSGPVVIRKKSLGARFKGFFFGHDAKGALRYITGDVLLPAVKNMVVDATSKGIERMIYGESAPRRRMEMGRTKFSYNTPVNRGYSQRAMLPDQPPYSPQRRNEPGEIVLQSREEAIIILDKLAMDVEKYQFVSVADLHEYCGLPSAHIDQKWGWSNLQGSSVMQTRDGFLLDLPLVEPR